MRWISIVVCVLIFMGSNICFSQQSGFAEIEEATEDWFMFPDKIIFKPTMKLSDQDRQELNDVQDGIEETMDRPNCNRKPVEVIEPMFHVGTMELDLGQYGCRDVAVSIKRSFPFPIAFHHLHRLRYYDRGIESWPCITMSIV